MSPVWQGRPYRSIADAAWWLISRCLGSGEFKSRWCGWDDHRAIWLLAVHRRDRLIKGWRDHTFEPDHARKHGSQQVSASIQKVAEQEKKSNNSVRLIEATLHESDECDLAEESKSASWITLNAKAENYESCNLISFRQTFGLLGTTLPFVRRLKEQRDLTLWINPSKRQALSRVWYRLGFPGVDHRPDGTLHFSGP